MTEKSGIKKHGENAVAVMYNEFFQLDDKTVFEGLMVTDLKQKQKKMALRAINLIKEKRCGKLKGRKVAYGSEKIGLYAKEETASPTISNDALLMTMLVDDWEDRDVATADVGGAYLHADMNDYTLLKLEGVSVDIMCEVNPAYKKLCAWRITKRYCT